MEGLHPAVQGGLCPDEVSVHGGLCLGVSVQGVSVQGVSVQGVFVWDGISVQSGEGEPPCEKND